MTFNADNRPSLQNTSNNITAITTMQRLHHCISINANRMTWPIVPTSSATSMLSSVSSLSLNKSRACYAKFKMPTFLCSRSNDSNFHAILAAEYITFGSRVGHYLHQPATKSKSLNSWCSVSPMWRRSRGGVSTAFSTVNSSSKLLTSSGWRCAWQYTVSRYTTK